MIQKRRRDDERFQPRHALRRAPHTRHRDQDTPTPQSPHPAPPDAQRAKPLFLPVPQDNLIQEERIPSRATSPFEPTRARRSVHGEISGARRAGPGVQSAPIFFPSPGLPRLRVRTVPLRGLAQLLRRFPTPCVVTPASGLEIQRFEPSGGVAEGELGW